MKHFLLSCGGGGARGVISNQVLHSVESRLYGPIAQNFNAVYGCSTGAIQALALTRQHAYSAASLDAMYMELLPRVFKKRFWSLGGWAGATYPADALEAELQARLGAKATLRDSQCSVGVVAYNLLAREPVMLTTESHPSLTAWEAARMSSAAPSFFPPYRNYCDGGLAANLPGAWGALHYAYTHHVPLSDIHLLSLGTGTSEKPILGSTWGGKASLVADVIDIALSASEDLAHAACQELGLASYTHVQAALPEGLTAMDNVSTENLFALRDFGARLALDFSAQLDAFCSALIAARSR